MGIMAHLRLYASLYGTIALERRATAIYLMDTQQRRHLNESKSLFLSLVLVSPLSLFAQSAPEFPTDNEISTLMQQANLAMKQYQTAMLGKDADAKQNEKGAFENWQFLLSVVKAKPDNFNSGVGFFVVDQLNTA